MQAEPKITSQSSLLVISVQFLFLSASFVGTFVTRRTHNFLSPGARQRKSVRNETVDYQDYTAAQTKQKEKAIVDQSEEDFHCLFRGAFK